MYNFEKPLNMIKRLNFLLQEYGKLILGFLNESGPLEAAVYNLLENSDDRVRNIKDLDEYKYILVNKNKEKDIVYDSESVIRIGVPGKSYVILCLKDGSAYDCNRCTNDLLPVDFVLIMQCLRFSYNARYVLLHYNDMGMWNVMRQINRDAQFESGFYLYDQILKECRSVIIDLYHVKIVSLPFAKFFNMNECEDYSEDVVREKISKAEHVEFTDKLDGSFVQIKYIEDTENFSENLLISTSGSVSVKTNDYLKYIKKYIGEHPENKYHRLCKQYKNYTFMFELIAPKFDPHVVAYDEEDTGLYLIGARNVKNGDLMLHDELASLGAKYNIPFTEYYNGLNLDEALHICENSDATDKEGFVCIIDDFMVKIKTRDFFRVAKNIQKVTFKSVAKALIDERFDDFIAGMPDMYKSEAEKIKNKIVNYNLKMRAIIENITDQVPDYSNFADAMKWIRSNVPSEWTAYIINSLKKGIDSLNKWCFISKNMNASGDCGSVSENEFNERLELMQDWIEENNFSI